MESYEARGSDRSVFTDAGQWRPLTMADVLREQQRAQQLGVQQINGGPSASPSTMTGALADRLMSTLAWAQDLAQRAEAMADRANGPVPPEPTSNAPRAERSIDPPMGQQLHQQVDVIEAALRRLQAAHQRLGEFV